MFIVGGERLSIGESLSDSGVIGYVTMENHLTLAVPFHLPKSKKIENRLRSLLNASWLSSLTSSRKAQEIS